MNKPVDGEVLYEVEVPEEDLKEKPLAFDAFRVTTDPALDWGARIEARAEGRWYDYNPTAWLVLHLLTQLRGLEPLRKAAVVMGETKLAALRATVPNRDVTIADYRRALVDMIQLCCQLAEEGETKQEA